MTSENERITVDDFGLFVDGRYKGTCKSIELFTSGQNSKDPGATGYKVITEVEGVEIQDWLMTRTSEKMVHKMNYRFNHFIRACGITNTKRTFEITFAQLLGKIYDVDLTNDGHYNKVKEYFLPESEPSTIPGVPAEASTMPGVPPEEPTQAEAPGKTEDVSDL